MRKGERLEGATAERRNCRTTQLPNDATAKRRNCQTTQLPNNATAKQRNCQTAQLPNSATAKQRSCQTTQLSNNATVKQRNCQTTQLPNSARAEERTNAGHLDQRFSRDVNILTIVMSRLLSRQKTACVIRSETKFARRWRMVSSASPRATRSARLRSAPFPRPKPSLMLAPIDCAESRSCAV